MSMISSLIDELNKCVDEWNGSNMFELARMCRSAADTITELRGALQVASVDYRHLSEENAKLREQGARLFDKTLELGTENAKLREERDHWHVEQVHAYGNWEDAYKRAIELEKQNAKLRELVDGLTWCCEHYGCRQECPLYDVSEPDHCLEVSIKRELGIEVEQ